jgi:hypothetical protein
MVITVLQVSEQTFAVEDNVFSAAQTYGVCDM